MSFYMNNVLFSSVILLIKLKFSYLMMWSGYLKSICLNLFKVGYLNKDFPRLLKLTPCVNRGFLLSYRCDSHLPEPHQFPSPPPSSDLDWIDVIGRTDRGGGKSNLIYSQKSVCQLTINEKHCKNCEKILIHYFTVYSFF